MSTRSSFSLALLAAASILFVPTAGWAQASAPIAAPEAKLRPLPGQLPPHCETCGTVVAINSVETDELPPTITETSAKPQKKLPRTVYEVVVRLNAGTQQIVTVDRYPDKLTIGQRVRITDGVVVPDLG
ncbi:hypothetical protein [Piscinibacter sakaiensis]|uniref:hypothetical protein n=1 Tax=Piscinibacter sakaiensis TaxID=1547922 RepID=UPI003AAFB43C